MSLLSLWVACRAAGLSFLEEPAAEPGQPLVVVIHGYGDRPESMMRALESCHLPAHVLAPRGPEPHPNGEGYAWYPVTFTRAGVEQDGEHILAAGGPLVALIERLRRERQPPRVVVTGFSQGGILSLLLASRFPEVIDAAVPVAGALPEDLLPQRAPAGAPPVRALHGSTDPLLPAAETRALVQQLAARGWDAEIEVFEGVAHQITPEVHAAWCRELGLALEDPERREAR